MKTRQCPRISVGLMGVSAGPILMSQDLDADTPRKHTPVARALVTISHGIRTRRWSMQASRVMHSVSLCVLAVVICLVPGWSAQVFATDSTFYQLDYPGAVGTSAQGINDSRQIVGYYTDSLGGFHGFLDTNGLFANFDVEGASRTQALGINNAGDIVGRYNNSTGLHGFLRTSTSFQTIDVLGATATIVNGINLTGTQIVGEYASSSGTHGFLFDNGTVTPIDVPGATHTFAEGINSGGDIVGGYLDSTGSHGFLMTKQGRFTTIDVPGASSTTARDINKSDQIVGAFLDSTGNVHGFLEDRHGNFTVIDYPGTTNTTRIFGINTGGDFVGEFTSLGLHGFLDPPAADTIVNPEPSTWLLMGTGLIAMLLWGEEIDNRPNSVYSLI